MATKMYIVQNVPITSLATMLECLFTNPDGSPRLFANPTYLDIECTVVECTGSRRSFEDLLVLANTYFPGTTEEDLMKAIIEVNLGYLYCPDIKKIVFCVYPTKLTKENLDEAIDWDKPYCNEETFTPDRLMAVYSQI